MKHASPARQVSPKSPQLLLRQQVVGEDARERGDVKVIPATDLNCENCRAEHVGIGSHDLQQVGCSLRECEGDAQTRHGKWERAKGERATNFGSGEGEREGDKDTKGQPGDAAVQGIDYANREK